MSDIGDDPTVDVRVDPAAVKFARARGGVILISASGAGLLRVSVKPQKDSAEWETVSTDGIEVRIDPALASLQAWELALRRFPRKTLIATSDMTRSPMQDAWGSGLGI